MNNLYTFNEFLNENTIALGQCYSYAYMQAVNNIHNPRGVKIVYGTVDEWDGKRIKHAWVNDKGLIKDWQTMELGTSNWANKGIPEKEFKKHWKPKIFKEYTPSEVVNNVRDYKKLMAWDWPKK
jgi:hypothetical protein